MPITVYTWGYTREGTRDPWPIHALEQVREERSALIVDTRIKPYSRFKEWAMPNLRRVFRSNYTWIEDFGNLNYDSWTKPIVLADPAKGLAWLLKKGLSQTRPPLLLCMCPTTFCHRTEVAKYLAEHAGWTIEHLVPEHAPKRVALPRNLPLF